MNRALSRLVYSDMIAGRWMLGIGALLWGVFLFWPGALFPTDAQITAGAGRSTYALMAQIAPEWLWATAFTLHGSFLLLSAVFRVPPAAALIDAVEVRLQPVLTGIAQWNLDRATGNAVPVGPKEAALDGVATRTTLIQLIDLLRQDSSQALPAIDQLRALLAGHPLAQELETLAKQTHAYDYESALASAIKLARDLRIQLNDA